MSRFIGAAALYHEPNRISSHPPPYVNGRDNSTWRGDPCSSCHPFDGLCWPTHAQPSWNRAQRNHPLWDLRSPTLAPESNEAAPRLHQMERSGAGGVAVASTTAISDNPCPAAIPITFYEGDGMVEARVEQDVELILHEFRGDGADQPDPEAASYVSAPDSEVRRAANMLVGNGVQTSLQLGGTEPSMSGLLDGTSGLYGDYDMPPDMVPTPAPDPDEGKAYAMLRFPDGDFFVTTFSVTVGRDMTAFKQFSRQRKAEKKAQRAMRQYEEDPEEPPTPVAPTNDEAGENVDPSSNSSQALVGRPAPSLPSNFSEHGGVAAYEPSLSSEADLPSSQRRRRKQYLSKSSSTTSVAPANLHTNPSGDMTYANPFYAPHPDDHARSAVHLPVHPQDPADMKRISRRHIEISYNLDEQVWELDVLGISVYLNGVLLHKGANVKLSHNDEIIITSVQFRFKLPDTAIETDEDEEESVGGRSRFSSSPARRLSSAVTIGFGSCDESDGDDEEQSVTKEVANTTRRPKLKLKLKKRKSNGWTKSKKKEATTPVPASQSKAKPGKGKKKTDPTAKENEPEAASKREAHKGNKPKKAAMALKQPETLPDAALPKSASTAAVATEKQPSVSQPPPTIPENLPPGSIFEGIDASELPQKRTGPGRPPNNGLVSKRDDSGAKRIKRDLEKAGLPVPPYRERVDQFRAETKAKEAAAKATAAGGSGVVPTDMNIVVQSIEGGHTTDARASALPTTECAAFAGPNGTPSASQAAVNRTSPKPKRPLRSPSPQKPEHEYTEEELRKPSATYVVLIDEALREYPTGIMDLQQIYDKICKKYPFYKYKAGSSGWQSSVRHNLISCERFTEAGKQGKGRLWKIDQNVPIDATRKRKVPSPPPPSMHSATQGQCPPGPNGLQYGGPYGPLPPQAGLPGFQHDPPLQHGQGQANGGPIYYSPYAPSGPQPQGDLPGHNRSPAQGNNMGGLPVPPCGPLPQQMQMQRNGPPTNHQQQQQYPQQNKQQLQHQQNAHHPTNSIMQPLNSQSPMPPHMHGGQYPAPGPPGPPQHSSGPRPPLQPSDPSHDTPQPRPAAELDNQIPALVQEMMAYRHLYLSAARNDEERDFRDAIFTRCSQQLTAKELTPGASPEVAAEEARVWDTLDGIIKRQRDRAVGAAALAPGAMDAGGRRGLLQAQNNGALAGLPVALAAPPVPPMHNPPAAIAAAQCGPASPGPAPGGGGGPLDLPVATASTPRQSEEMLRLGAGDVRTGRGGASGSPVGVPPLTPERMQSGVDRAVDAMLDGLPAAGSRALGALPPEIRHAVHSRAPDGSDSLSHTGAEGALGSLRPAAAAAATASESDVENGCPALAKAITTTAAATPPTEPITLKRPADDAADAPHGKRVKEME